MTDAEVEAAIAMVEAAVANPEVAIEPVKRCAGRAEATDAKNGGASGHGGGVLGDSKNASCYPANKKYILFIDLSDSGSSREIVGRVGFMADLDEITAAWRLYCLWL